MDVCHINQHFDLACRTANELGFCNSVLVSFGLAAFVFTVLLQHSKASRLLSVLAISSIAFILAFGIAMIFVASNDASSLSTESDTLYEIAKNDTVNHPT